MEKSILFSRLQNLWVLGALGKGLAARKFCWAWAAPTSSKRVNKVDFMRSPV
jgi:hypothetical protein